MPRHSIARPATIEVAIERTRLRLQLARREVVPMVYTREEIETHEKRLLAELERVSKVAGGMQA
jgi:hypothetical protein